MGYFGRYGGWPKYVSAAEKKAKAEKEIEKQKKKGAKLHPVVVTGRAIAKTFWGKAWCENLESYSDLSNRLPRGRTYIRNGSVIDLQLANGMIEAQVMGSSLYKVTVSLQPMVKELWSQLVAACVGKIDSLIELLQGKFSQAVMEIMTQKQGGLFPKPKEITMRCSCPDHAGMCKHIAAVLYGVGALLDTHPEWFFKLRHVDHLDLIAKAQKGEFFDKSQEASSQMADDELSALFGIELDSGASNKPMAKETETETEIETKQVLAEPEKLKEKAKRNTKKRSIVTDAQVKIRKTSSKTQPVQRVKVSKKKIVKEKATEKQITSKSRVAKKSHIEEVGKKKSKKG